MTEKKKPVEQAEADSGLKGALTTAEKSQRPFEVSAAKDFPVAPNHSDTLPAICYDDEELKEEPDSVVIVGASAREPLVHVENYRNGRKQKS